MTYTADPRVDASIDARMTSWEILPMTITAEESLSLKATGFCAAISISLIDHTAHYRFMTRCRARDTGWDSRRSRTCRRLST